MSSDFQYELRCNGAVNCKHSVRLGDMKCPQHGCPFGLIVPSQKQNRFMSDRDIKINIIIMFILGFLGGMAV